MRPLMLTVALCALACTPAYQPTPVVDDDPADTEIEWTRHAPGWAWTAGEPSTSSIVVRSVPVGFDNDRREEFLHAICDLWTKTTGCSVNEVVATAFDGPLSR